MEGWEAGDAGTLPLTVEAAQHRPEPPARRQSPWRGINRRADLTLRSNTANTPQRLLGTGERDGKVVTVDDIIHHGYCTVGLEEVSAQWQIE